MTKAEIIRNITQNTGVDQQEVQRIVEEFLLQVKGQLAQGEPVYFRSFGSFILKRRARKTGRNISKNTSLVIEAHNIPYFKPAKVFAQKVRRENPANS